MNMFPVGAIFGIVIGVVVVVIGLLTLVIVLCKYDNGMLLFT